MTGHNDSGVFVDSDGKTYGDGDRLPGGLWFLYRSDYSRRWFVLPIGQLAEAYPARGLDLSNDGGFATPAAAIKDCGGSGPLSLKLRERRASIRHVAVADIPRMLARSARETRGANGHGGIGEYRAGDCNRPG